VIFLHFTSVVSTPKTPPPHTHTPYQAACITSSSLAHTASTACLIKLVQVVKCAHTIKPIVSIQCNKTYV